MLLLTWKENNMFRRSTNNPWISPSGFLNSGGFEAIGGADTAPGAGQRFPGLLGQTVVHSNATALKASRLATGTLFEGIYQLVRYAPGVTTISRGQLVFWDTLANNGIPNFRVTGTSTATTNFRAGVALAAETAGGNLYAWIQVAGMASILFGASPAAADGQLVIQATAADTPLLTVATVNTFADATAVPTTVAWHKSRVGINYGVPTASVPNRVLMDLNAFVPNIG